MTGNELSTIIRHGFAPILIILDNHGYGTERYLHEGNWKYNEINPWHYHKLPEIFGGGRGYLVSTEGEFAAALAAAWEDSSCVQIIQAKLAEGDASTTLLRLAERLGQHVS
ncbi:MAG: thiamine pyrophosphate-dependent enzyme [Pirellulaceae bacterium]